MYLTRHQTPDGPRWALDNAFLPASVGLGLLLEVDAASLGPVLASLPRGDTASGSMLAPLESEQEVWASGVTYMRSREARMAESDTRDVYDKVYEAERPELFFKASGRRTIGPGAPVRIRRDSHWNVPEPELVVVANIQGEIVGYSAGNDMSSRDIEGANPLYLPQAKVYDGACALGPGIVLCPPGAMHSLPIRLTITRDGASVFVDETSVSQMKRTPEELIGYLYREITFPEGAFLMTGTGIVPGEDFTLQPGDVIEITVGELTLVNTVGA